MDKNYVKTFSLFWDAFKWIVGLLLSILLALSYVFLTPFCMNIFIPAAVIFVCVSFNVSCKNKIVVTKSACSVSFIPVLP